MVAVNEGGSVSPTARIALGQTLVKDKIGMGAERDTLRRETICEISEPALDSDPVAASAEDCEPLTARGALLKTMLPRRMSNLLVDPTASEKNDVRVSKHACCPKHMLTAPTTPSAYAGWHDATALFVQQPESHS